MSAEQTRLEEARQGKAPWKKWGPYLSERQWGTVREDYSDNGDAWNYFPHDQARSRAYRWGEDGLAGVSRRPAAALLRARALERQGPDPQGAPVRAHQQRGQPRRGREGVLLLPRLDADALVHEVPLQVPAGGLPLRRHRRDEPRPQPAGARVRAARHRRLRRGPLLRRLRRVRQGGARGPADRDHRLQPRPGAGHAARAADALVPQHLVVGRRRPRARRCGRSARDARGSVDRAQRPGARRALPVRRGPGRACSSPRTRRTASACSATPNRTPYVKDAFDRYLVHGDAGAVNPERTGTKAAVHYTLEVGARKSRTLRLRLGDAAPAHGERRRSPDFEAVMQARRREADEFYATVIPASLGADAANVMRQALAGMMWSKQFYNYDLDTWLVEHGADPFEPRARRPAQRPLAPHGERRRHLDARQVGVPVVRGLGPGVPRARAHARRRGLRQGAARPDAAGPLPAPERADPGLRVELRRREPAGPRLGHDLHLPPREGAARAGRHRVARALVPEAAAELHLVGEPQGPHGPQRLRGRLPRARQHRRLRPQRAAADRRLPGAGRRHRLDGALQPEHARDRRAARAREAGLRRHVPQVRPALPVDRVGDGPRRRGRGDVGRGGRLLLRRAAAARRQLRTPEGALDGRAAPALRRHRLRGRAAREVSRDRRSACAASSRRGRSSPPRSTIRRRSGQGGRRLASILDETRLRRVLAKMLDESEFFGPYGIRALSRYHAEHPYVFNVGRPGVPRRLPARRVRLRHVRRQLQLARAGLDAGQRAHHPRAAAVLRVLRRRLQDRVPDRLRARR